MKKIEESRNKRKEARARANARRIRSLVKKGMTKEQIDELFKKEDNRFVLCLIYGSYTIEDGTKEVVVVKRDKRHHVVSKEKQTVPNVLHGLRAAVKFAENNKLTVIGTSSTPSMWVKTDKTNVDEVVEMLHPIGRCSVTKPVITPPENDKVKEKKPSNNNAEVANAAKNKRKADAKNRAEMRTYYAALRALKRRGNFEKLTDKDVEKAISSRIRKHNKTLADKIKSWIKEKTKDSEEYRAKHRQLTSQEMKSRKKARKVIKSLALKKRRVEREKKLAEKNEALRAKRAQKAQKPVQTELKMAALL